MMKILIFLYEKRPQFNGMFIGLYLFSLKYANLQYENEQNSKTKHCRDMKFGTDNKYM